MSLTQRNFGLIDVFLQVDAFFAFWNLIFLSYFRSSLVPVPCLYEIIVDAGSINVVNISAGTP